MNPACRAALDALQRSLAAGAELAAGSQGHLAACGDCRARLAAALGGRDEPRPAPDAAALEAAARRRYRGRRVARAAVLGLAALLVAGAGAGALTLRGASWRVGGAGLAALVLGLLALAGALAMALGRLPGRLGLYKRLGPGRQVSGVCLGLAERTGTPAWAWRAGFVGLLALGGGGLWLYLLLDLFMPVHPEDRPRMLRYRLSRWWRGPRAA